MRLSSGDVEASRLQNVLLTKTKHHSVGGDRYTSLEYGLYGYFPKPESASPNFNEYLRTDLPSSDNSISVATGSRNQPPRPSQTTMPTIEILAASVTSREAGRTPSTIEIASKPLRPSRPEE